MACPKMRGLLLLASLWAVAAGQADNGERLPVCDWASAVATRLPGVAAPFLVATQLAARCMHASASAFGWVWQWARGDSRAVLRFGRIVFRHQPPDPRSRNHHPAPAAPRGIGREARSAMLTDQQPR